MSDFGQHQKTMTTKKEKGEMEIISVYDLSPKSRKNKDRLDPLVEIQQDVCRHVINTEIMMLYGHDVSGYLPPLPKQDRPRSSLAAAWDCENQAVRQLGNVTRRGPRDLSLRGSSAVSKSTNVIDKTRPHTAFCSHVRGILNTKPSDIRPHTAGVVLDRTNNKKLQPVKEPAGLIMPRKLHNRGPVWSRPSSSSERLSDLQDDPTEAFDGVSEVASTVPVAGGGLRKPKWGVARKTRGQSHKKKVVNMDHLSDDISRVLKGDLDNLPDHPPTAVKIYLCSHPKDMLSEKEALEREAYPALREYCQTLGLEFQVVDTLLDSRYNPQDYSFHARQLDRCQRQSIGPNCVVLLGDLYGSAFIPLTLTVKDFQFLHKAATVSILVEPTLLEECYKLENNTVPPAYVLQGAEQMSQNRLTELRYVLKHSVLTAVQIGKFRPERECEFETSELELLIKEGVTKLPGQQAALRCLCFHRKFIGIEEDLANNLIAEFTDIDFSDGKVLIDKAKQQRLDSLTSSIHSHVGDSNMKVYDVSWHGKGIQQSRSKEHADYLKQFVEDFVDGTRRLIDMNNSLWNVRHAHFPLYKEVLLHNRMCADNMVIYTDRLQVTDQIKEALVNKQRNDCPLLIIGKKGTGKTSVLGNIVKIGGSLINKLSYCAVYHQIGLTPRSTNIRELLATICHQLSINYNIDPPSESDCKSINRILRMFSAMLETISKHHGEKKPLFILLDDIQKLLDNDRAKTFFWLPQKCPKNIFMIFTTNTKSLETIDRLQKRCIPLCNIVTVPSMTSLEANSLLNALLQENNRTLSDVQKEAVEASMERGVLPLHIKLHAFEILKWKSNETKLPELHTSLSDHLKTAFKELDQRFGSHLVRTIITYMSILPWGISAVELEDSVLANSSVIEEAMSRKHQQSSLYTAVKCQIHHLVDRLMIFGLLKETSAQGRTFLSWKNDSLSDFACSEYYGVGSWGELNSQTLMKLYQHLYTLFSQETGVWLENRELYRSIGICFITPQLLLPPNTRKLQIMPHLISQCTGIDGDDQFTYLKKKCLCEFQWLLNKLQGTSIEDTLADFQLVQERDLEVDLIHNLLTMCGFGLQQNPSSLSLQLLGTVPHLDALRYPLLARMIESARAWVTEQKSPILLPIFQCFPSPFDVCKAKIWDISDIIYVQKGTNMAVVKSKDSSLEIWDMTNKEWVYQLGVKFDKVTKNIFCNTDMVLAVNAPHTLQLWEIESGSEVLNVNLEEVFGENISSMACQAHSDTFELVAFTLSDDEFNQSLTVMNTSNSRILMKNDKFDLKDEFFPGAAAFLSVQQETWLVAAYARSEVGEDDNAMDFVKILIYNITRTRHVHSIACGSKKFQSLLTFEDRLVIISWANSSFDMYSVEHGTHVRHLTQPDVDLIIDASCITSDGYLVALAASSPNKEDIQKKMYHGLWVWNLEEGSHSELFTSNHSSTEEIPKQFTIIEELHLAVVGIPELAKISVWDLPTSTCIYTTVVHTEGLDRLLKYPDPYKILTCSSTEKVVKIWDLYNLVTSNRKQPQVGVEKTSELESVRSSSSLSVHSDGIKTPESILRNPDSRATSETPFKMKAVRFADSNDAKHTKDSNCDVTNAGLSTPEDSSPSQTATSGTTGQVTMYSQLKSMFDVTMARFTRNSEFVVTASNKGMPTIWDVKTGYPTLYLMKYGQDDVATPWFDLACEDKYIVGTTLNNRPRKEGWPQTYKLQVWLRESGKIHPAVHENKDIFITKCVVLHDGERVLVTVLDHYRPGDKAEVQLHILGIENLEVLHKVRVYLPQLPTEIQMTGDSMYTILVSPAESGKAKKLTVYNLEDESRGEFPTPETYEFRHGDKFKRYGVTSNIILRNGISLASGFNGDLQLWDISSGEYEGNLYDDPGTKEKANPGLHNHKGKMINHMVVSEDGRYLLCGGGDATTSLWDLDSEVMTHSYRGHKDEVCRVAISRDNHIVLTAGADCMLYVWPFAGDRPLCLLHVHVIPTELQVAEDKQTVCIVGHRHNEPSRFMMFRLLNLKLT